MSLFNNRICVAVPFISISVFIALLFAFATLNPNKINPLEFLSAGAKAHALQAPHLAARLAAPSADLAVVEDASLPLVLLPRASAQAPAIDETMLVWHDDRKDENGWPIPTNVWAMDLAGQRNQGEPFPITTERFAQMHPDVYGDWVVYEDNRNGDWDIWATNLTSSETITLVVKPGQQRFPKIWGDYVVYQDEGNDWLQSDVALYQISTQQTTVLGGGDGYQARPDIDSNQVVWVDSAGPDGWRLGIYKIDTQQTSFHTIACNYECRPRLSNGEVVWPDRRNSDWDIYLLDVNTLVETAIYTGTGDQLNPAISDTNIAWQDDGTYGNPNIFVQPRIGGQPFPVSVEPSVQAFPALGSTHVVWQDNRSHTWNLRGFALGSQPSPIPSIGLDNPTDLVVGAFPNGELHLSWTDTTTNETSFVIQRAVGIFNTDWQDYFTAAPNTNRFIDGATTIGQSYWYRVRAVGPSGDSTYTNEAYSTSFGSVPSMDEQYQLLLINEARMDPSSWGYPSEPAVNPIAWQPNLAYAARAHALGMNNSDCCQGHTDLALGGPSDRAQASGYSGFASENLFVGEAGRAGMEAVHQGFMDSTLHRINILDPNAKHGGIGFAPGGRGTVVEKLSRGTGDITIPTLPTGIAVPYTGTVETEFVFLVSFWNETLTPPTVAQVVIDSQAHPLILRSGVAGRGTYAYTTTLGLGPHDYFFQFEWGSPERTERLPTAGTLSGPFVRDKRWYVNNSVPTSGAGYLPDRPFRTIGEAIAEATSGDVIEVSAGLYEEQFEIPAGVHLQGMGRDVTLLRGNGSGTVVSMGNESTLQGFTVFNGGTDYWDANIWIEPGNSASIRESLILSGSMGIANVCVNCATPCTSTLELTNNILVNHKEIAVNSHCNLRAVNNTVAANGQGFFVGGQDVKLKNNIVVINDTIGIAGEAELRATSAENAPLVGIDISYNNVWQNGQANYQDVLPGPGSLEENPGFVDPGNGNLQLWANSVCVDAGDPAPEFNDGNGTRGDMGAYGGPLVNTEPIPAPPEPTAVVEPSPVVTNTITPTATTPAETSTVVPTTEPIGTPQETAVPPVETPTAPSTALPAITATTVPTGATTPDPGATPTPAGTPAVDETPEPTETAVDVVVTPPTPGPTPTPVETVIPEGSATPDPTGEPQPTATTAEGVQPGNLETPTPVGAPTQITPAAPPGGTTGNAIYLPAVFK